MDTENWTAGNGGLQVGGSSATMHTEGRKEGKGFEEEGGADRMETYRGSPLTTPLPTLSSLVFAYGATGAGKTHTMLGREGDPGIMYLTTMELYRRLEACREEKRFEVLISYLEVRLLAPQDGAASSLILTTT